MNRNSKTNLARFDTLTDEMIDTSDAPPLTEAFFDAVQWRMPKKKVKITVEVDDEVAEWFKAQGERYQEALAGALRMYAQTHQE